MKAIQLANILNGLGIDVFFLGVIDPVNTWFPTQPHDIPPNVDNYWSGYASGPSITDPAGLILDTFVFPEHETSVGSDTWDWTKRDGDGDPVEYDESHVHSGHTGYPGGDKALDDLETAVGEAENIAEDVEEAKVLLDRERFLRELEEQRAKEEEEWNKVLLDKLVFEKRMQEEQERKQKEGLQPGDSK